MSTRSVLVIISLFLLVVIVGIGLASSGNQPSSSGALSELLTPASEEPEVIAATKAQKIEERVQDTILQMPATVSFAFVDLENAEAVRINNQEKYVSASLYKLFVAYYAYNQIDTDQVRPNTVVDDKTLSSCLELMISISDNECGVAVGEYFGWTNITNFAQGNGFKDTVIVRTEDPESEFITSPNDIESFFVRLYSEQLLSEVSTKSFIDSLLNQQINDRLPVVIPSGSDVAHKTGDVYEYIHDAGIVFSDDGDYVFVIMTSNWDPSMTFGPGYEYFKVIYDTLFSIK